MSEQQTELPVTVGATGQNVYEAFRRSPYLSNKHSSYFQTYGELFEKYRGKPVTFVEIGVFSGGSLFIWRDHFGPQARVIGVGLNPDAVSWREHGFKIHIGNHSDPKFWHQFFESVGHVDIVLDDGGHTYEQQISTVHHCLPHIKDDGMIAVEDTHNCYFKDLGYSSRNSDHSIEAFESIVAFKINRAACISGRARQSLKTPAAPEVLPLSIHCQ